MSKVKIILGIDPGTNVMGYGLIKVEGSELTLIEFSDISLKKYDDHYLKLKEKEWQEYLSFFTDWEVKKTLDI